MHEREYPYVGALWHRCRHATRPNFVGSAVLVAREWILTAPHVLMGLVEDATRADVTALFDGVGRKAVRVEPPILRWRDACQTWDEWKRGLTSFDEQPSCDVDEGVQSSFRPRLRRPR
jgi:hypothetical protein